METSKKQRVGCLTTFYEFSSSYSLCSVVETQLASLVKYGYRPVLFTHDNFKDDAKVPEGVEIRKIVPRFLLVDYSNFQDPTEDFEEQVTKIYQALEEHAKDIDIMIEHDFLLQGWFLQYCVAIHRYADNYPKTKWFHWIHSVPSGSPKNLKYPHNMRFQLPKNSKLVYLNNTDIIRASEAYGIFPKDVRIVHNSVDPRMFWNLHPLVNGLIDKYGLLDKNIIQVYPVSTPRMMTGKQLGVVIEIFAQLKKLGNSVALIVCNAHANDKREKAIIAEAMSFSNQQGLSANDIIFTSLEEAPKWELGVPREVVSQLFRLSNLFIFPTTSENCPLILLEAMSAKNLLILNKSVTALREFGKENALYFSFGGRDENVEYDNRDGFMEDVAKIIVTELNINRPLKAFNDYKKSYNFDNIFKKFIEPLFFEHN